MLEYNGATVLTGAFPQVSYFLANQIRSMAYRRLQFRLFSLTGYGRFEAKISTASSYEAIGLLRNSGHLQEDLIFNRF